VPADALDRPVVLHSGDDIFRVVAAPLVLGDGSTIGMLFLATLLDVHFARAVSTLANVPTVIVSQGALVASTLPAENGAVEEIVGSLREGAGTLRTSRGSYEYRELVPLGDTSVYAIQSVDESAKTPIAATNQTLLFIGAGALAIALAASVWLAHLFGAPIGALSEALSRMAASKNFSTRIQSSGSSRELDRLTDTFNTLMASVEIANEETAVAYTSAIRALAAALDARDPYTAGHSERVSTLSVAIGREMELPESELEILRLGALLHDIGKIGVPDAILLKPGRLTEDEFAVIRQHPTLGARILKNVPFLAPHLPIVELHHERPDGGGYPHGLQQQDIPLAAHIVHVADAYDAMTSARSYRRERPTTTALRELWAGAGTEFHADAVAALAKAVPGLAMVYETPLEALSA
jgi:putative nucleotidyltransferase with HDIG domain